MIVVCPHGQVIGAQGGVTASDIASHADFADGVGVLEFYSACDCCDTLMHHSCCGESYFVMKDGRTLCADCAATEPEKAFDGMSPQYLKREREGITDTPSTAEPLAEAPKCLRDDRFDDNMQGPCSAGSCMWPECGGEKEAGK